MIYANYQESLFGKDIITAHTFPWERKGIIIKTILYLDTKDNKFLDFNTKEKIYLMSLCFKIMDMQNYVDLTDLIKNSIFIDFENMYSAYRLEDYQAGIKKAIEYNKLLDFFIRYIYPHLFPFKYNYIEEDTTFPWLPEHSIKMLDKFITEHQNNVSTKHNIDIISMILKTCSNNGKIIYNSREAIKILEKNKKL